MAGKAFVCVMSSEEVLVPLGIGRRSWDTEVAGPKAHILFREDEQTVLVRLVSNKQGEFV